MNNSFIYFIKITLLFWLFSPIVNAAQDIHDFITDYQYSLIKKQPNQSIAVIKQGLQEHPLSSTENYFANHNLAYSYFKADKKKLAISHISAAISLANLIDNYHQAKSFLLRARIYGILFRDTDTAILDLQASTNLVTSSQHIKSIELHFNILTSLAQAYNQNSNLNKAENYIDQAIVLATTLEDKNELIHALVISGRIYFQQDKLQKAYSQYLAALELTDENTAIERIASIELRLAMIFNEQDIFSDSLKHAKISVSLYHQTSNKRMQVKSLRVLGGIYLSLGDDVDMALIHLLNALSIAQNMDDPYGLGHIQHLIGTAYLTGADYNAAIKYLQSAQSVLEQAGSNFYLGLNTMAFARLEILQNAPVKAIAIMETLLTDARFTSYPALINRARSRLITMYVDQSDFEQAYQHQNVLLTAQQNKTEETKKSALHSLNSVIEVKSLKEELTSLKQQKSTASALITTLQNRFYSIIGVLVLSLLILVMLFFRFNNIKKHFRLVNKQKIISWHHFKQRIKQSASGENHAKMGYGGILIALPKLSENMKQAENRYFTGQNINHWHQQLINTFTPEESISHQQNLWMICSSRPKQDLEIINQQQNRHDDAGFQLVWLAFDDLPHKISDNLLVFIEELVHKADSELPWQQGVSWGEVKIKTNALSIIFTNPIKEKLYWRLDNALKRGLISFIN